MGKTFVIERTLKGFVWFSLAEDIDAAVAERVVVLKPTIQRRSGSYDYDGINTQPENVGWRFRQLYRIKDASRLLDHAPTPREIREGFYDNEIVEAFHDAASSTHYYDKEKSWR